MLEQFAAETVQLGRCPRRGRSRHCCGRTRMTVRDDLTAKYPAAWPARVSITLDDGAVLRAAERLSRAAIRRIRSRPPCWREKFSTLVDSRSARASRAASRAVGEIRSSDDMALTLRDIVPTRVAQDGR